MNKVVLLFIFVATLGLQACSSSGGASPSKSDGSSSSGGATSSSSSSSGSGRSSSSSSSSSSSNSSSSTSGFSGLSDAKTFIQDVRTLTRDLDSNKGTLTALGALLSGSSKDKYLAFSNQIEQSKLSGSQTEKLIGSEAKNVLNGLSQSGMAIIAELVNKHVSPGALTPPAGITVDYPEPSVVGNSSRRTETHSFKLLGEVDLLADCEGVGRSCLIKVDAEVQIVFKAGGSPGGALAGADQTMNLPDFEINIIKMAASNDYVRIAIGAATAGLSGSLKLRLKKVGTAYDSVNISAEQFKTNLTLTLSDKSADPVNLSANLTMSLPFTELNVDLASSTQTDVQVIYVEPGTLDANLKVMNAAGSSVEVQLNKVTASVVGMPPVNAEMGDPLFNYVFGDKFQTDETKTHFLDIDGLLKVEALIDGLSVYSLDARVGRDGGQQLGFDASSLKFGAKAYSLLGAVKNDGSIINATLSELSTGLKLMVTADNAGLRSGSLVGTSGVSYGIVSDIGNDSIRIRFTDGATIDL